MHNGLYKRLHYTLVYSPCGTSKLEWIWYQEFRVLIVSWGGFRLFCVITKGANSAELLSYMYIDRRIFRVAFRVAFSPKIVLFDIKI